MYTTKMLTCGVDFAATTRRWFFQILEDAALANRAFVVAMLPQGLKLLFQRRQLGDTLSDMSNMFVDQHVHSIAIPLGLIPITEQGADFIVSHVQRSAPADQLQPLQLCRIVMSIVTGGSAGQR